LAKGRRPSARRKARPRDFALHAEPERPIDRFAEEHRHLVGTAGHPSFRLEARQPRVVAEDYLVSFETNRYSVPFTLIGQAVEVLRGAGRIAIFHRETLVAEHPELPGKHQLRILSEHGPGAIARTARRVRSSRSVMSKTSTPFAEVEVRDPPSTTPCSGQCWGIPR
jgi:hypothetical protein